MQAKMFFAGWFILGIVLRGIAQEPERPAVPADSIRLRDIKGGMVPYTRLAGKNPVMLVCFWSVNSQSSIDELNAIGAQYEQWKKAGSFTMLAINVDAGSLVNRIRPTVNANGWTFEVYADITGDLQRLLSFNNVPQAMVLNKGQVVYQQAGYQAGSERYLFDKLRNLAPAKP